MGQGNTLGRTTSRFDRISILHFAPQSRSGFAWLPSAPSKSRSVLPGFPSLTGWDVGIVVLCLLRFLVPAEGVIEGSTLWITSGVFAFAAVWALFRWRRGESWTWRPTLLDAGAGLLVLGHVFSGMLVLFTAGELRGTVNSLWEWLSVGVLWILLRELLAVMPGRELWLRSLVLASVALSGLGVWQHFVWYPRLAAEFQEYSELTSRTESGPPLTSQEIFRHGELTREFGASFLAQDQTTRSLLLDRAERSTEPIGLFALTNSLAAILLTGCLLIVAPAPRWLRLPPLARACWTGALVLAGCCLLLTKSRTAYLASALGGLLLIAQLIGSARWSRRRAVVTGGAVLVLTLLAAAILGILGGLDLEVLSEAPKSLGYRLQYWKSTALLIADHPLWGVGPGNFRQHYLLYKLPGASEEIRDPHNLLLDVWANGGLLALVGLMLLLFRSARNLWRMVSTREVESASSPRDVVPLMVCGGVACGLAWGQSFLLDASGDLRLAALGGGWLLLTALLFRASAAGLLLQTGAAAAGAALVIHLLASGGIGMPAILQVLLGLMIVVENAGLSCNSPVAARIPPPSAAPFSTTGAWSWAGLAMASAAAVLGCVQTAWLPQLSASALLVRGTSQILDRQDTRAAVRMFQQATEADWLAAEPWLLLAQAHHAQWLSHLADNASFEAAIASQQAAIRRDPYSPKHPLLLAEWWLERHRHDPRPEFLEEAKRWSQASLDRYPEYSLGRAVHALAVVRSGAENLDEIRLALALDDGNRQARHVDKLLSLEMRRELERWLDFVNLRIQIRAAILRGEQPLVDPRYLEIFGWDRLLDGMPRR